VRRGDRIEDGVRSIAEVYKVVLQGLERRIGKERAPECLNTAIMEILTTWKAGSPPLVQDWNSYLAHSAGHVHVRRRRKDQRLIVYVPWAPQGGLPGSLDAPAHQAGPSEEAERWDEHEVTLVHLLTLSLRQIQVVLLWSLGFNFTEIGERLEMKPGHARVLKCQAIKAMKKRRGMGDSA
jgi:DNA-directed RNA polymerase specialized sigma24 family protein